MPATLYAEFLNLQSEVREYFDAKKVLPKIGGKRPGKKCGKSYIAADRKCKGHYSESGKLTEQGKASAQELAGKVRARKGMKPVEAAKPKQAKPLQFKTQEVEIPYYDRSSDSQRKRRVLAKVIGPVAIEKGSTTVSHAKSGLAIATTTTQKKAQAVARGLAERFGDELNKPMSELTPKEINNLRKATGEELIKAGDEIAGKRVLSEVARTETFFSFNDKGEYVKKRAQGRGTQDRKLKALKLRQERQAEKSAKELQERNAKYKAEQDEIDMRLAEASKKSREAKRQKLKERQSKMPQQEADRKARIEQKNAAEKASEESRRSVNPEGQGKLFDIREYARETTGSERQKYKGLSDRQREQLRNVTEDLADYARLSPTPKTISQVKKLQGVSQRLRRRIKASEEIAGGTRKPERFMKDSLFNDGGLVEIDRKLDLWLCAMP